MLINFEEEKNGFTLRDYCVEKNENKHKLQSDVCEIGSGGLVQIEAAVGILLKWLIRSGGPCADKCLNLSPV